MLVINGGTLIDGTGRDPLANATLVIDEAGRITHAGKRDTLPEDATVIDAAGKTIMPGLIDCHVHLFLQREPLEDSVRTMLTLLFAKAACNAKATLDAGVTTVRDMGGAPLGFKLGVEQGLIPGPRMCVSIAPLSQTGGHADFHTISEGRHPWPLPWGSPEWPRNVCDGTDECRKTVRAFLSAGADFIKLCTSGHIFSPKFESLQAQFSLEEIGAIVGEAKAQGKTCASHAESLEAVWRAVRGGVQSIEHGTFLDEEVISEMKARGTFLVPTCHYPVVLRERAEQQGAGAAPGFLAKAREVAAGHQASTRMAIASGVRIAMGTNAGVDRHGTNARELSLLVGNGMTPMQAIVAATRTAAECLGLSRDIGTLEPGKLADVLVVSGNPLDAIRVLETQSNLLMIIQGGRVYKDLIGAKPTGC